jgi:hypothetical protein
MVASVVPMHLTRWHAGVTAGRGSLSLAEGLRETLARWISRDLGSASHVHCYIFITAPGQACQRPGKTA